MNFVPGLSLGSNWHRATDTQRENLIKDICQSLKVINQIKPSELFLIEAESWGESLKISGEALVAKLKSKNSIDEATASKVLRKLSSGMGLFAADKVQPVYWDIHFDNFIVNDTFELQAIIDLENVALTALDYPLFVIQKQTDEPEKFLREEDEKYADKKDYEKLKGWYKKYYPEMFAFESIDARLEIYQLLDTLHLLVAWPQVKELYMKLDKLISWLTPACSGTLHKGMSYAMITLINEVNVCQELKIWLVGTWTGDLNTLLHKKEYPTT